MAKNDYREHYQVDSNKDVWLERVAWMAVLFMLCAPLWMQILEELME